jgi:hypothetical protein
MLLFYGLSKGSFGKIQLICPWKKISFCSLLKNSKSAGILRKEKKAFGKNPPDCKNLAESPQSAGFSPYRTTPKVIKKERFVPLILVFLLLQLNPSKSGTLLH